MTYNSIVFINDQNMYFNWTIIYYNEWSGWLLDTAIYVPRLRLTLRYSSPYLPS